MYIYKYIYLFIYLFIPNTGYEHFYDKIHGHIYEHLSEHLYEAFSETPFRMALSGKSSVRAALSTKSKTDMKDIDGMRHDILAMTVLKLFHILDVKLCF